MAPRSGRKNLALFVCISFRYRLERDTPGRGPASGPGTPECRVFCCAGHRGGGNLTASTASTEHKVRCEMLYTQVRTQPWLVCAWKDGQFRLQL